MTPNSLNTKLKNAIRIDRALKFVWQASPLYSILSGFIVLVLGVLPLASLYLIKLIIDSVTGLDFSPDTSLLDQDFSTPLLYIGMACAIGIFTAFFNFLSDYIKKAQSLIVTDHMFCVLHEKSVQADLAFYESPEYRNTLFRAQREGPYRPTSIVNNLFIATQSGASFAAVFGLLFLFNPILSITLVAAAVPGVLLRLKYSEKIYSWQEKRTEDERRAYYFHWMLTGDAHAKEFRLFNLGKHFIDQFKSIRKILNKEKLYFEKRRSLGDFIAQSSSTLAVFGSFAYIALKTAQGTITLGDMVMYFQGFQKGLGFLKTLLESGAQMYEDNLFLSHLYEFLTVKPQVLEPELPCNVPKKISEGIKFKNVNFSYQNSVKNVLNCVNFSINPGEIVALVGENGSGKSTIVKLLARLYDPQSGDIFLDGQNIKNFKTTDFRKKISAVFQDHIKYQLSAKENIFLGDTEQKDNISGIKEAARQTDADKKISSFPSGYDTILGRWFKDGEELSIGQWQMVAISRAFFRNAEIVILDEPSSALDPKTEMNIFSKLKKLIKGRAALVISHRYSTVKMADKILVLDKGHIIEQGSHEELIKENGKYAKLYNTQAGGYI
ncbi:MAG: ABC transporter ATP-binding protein/permease [Proteobacteria bacterium]|nr:ABC transporter ATP-binding protein/permease [Pseudomonadota bacterium]MBU1584871.1 ABC transporter ATP-binding protein/permease [Pseudomonadota bacterium]MBU2451885.1 ABC transporter ATP-binding protein/permease [Pseudomonadota bacterium]MBU2628755.1 ABC transporter ATP-binding protein/permease [Pseudomonadota bacterium]